MRRKAKASRLIYRAYLAVGAKRDASSGLLAEDRYFVPLGVPKAHPVRDLAIDTLVLACIVLGLLILTVKGFSVPVGRGLYGTALLLCLGTAALFQREKPSLLRYGLSLGLFLLFLLLLLLNQQAFLAGMFRVYACIIRTLNAVYNGSLTEIRVSGRQGESVFLGFTLVPLTLYLGNALLRRDHFLLAGMMLFPMIAALVLCGAAKNTVGLFLLLFGVVLALSLSQSRRQRRMWGGERTGLRKKNALRFASVQKKSVALMLAACIVLSVPGFLLVRPLLGFSMKGAEAAALQVQNGFLQRLLKLLPEISAGEWNLDLEAVGGGVLDGSLETSEGYLLEDIEDLRLTLTRRPTETLFLRGFVGSSYRSGSWESNYGSTFDGAAINWNTEGDPRLYIQNLPFLRVTYALLQRESGNAEISEAMASFSIEPAQLLVERINANEDYSYVPYGAYLNDYYEVQAGDGSVAGQTVQEDRYYFYFREEMETVLESWNALEDTANVLDRVEESYRALCVNCCMDVAEGLESLQEIVSAVKAENHWTAEEASEAISGWIRAYLAENYSYELVPEAAPAGEDALRYFLFSSRKGNSVQFASAAVELFRMFGVPARYVVGYEAPSAIFVAQPGGIFTATLQGDNSQAWAEIYVPGKGWLPKDMTPGIIGTLEEVGPGGEKIEAGVAEREEEETKGDVPEASSGPEADEEALNEASLSMAKRWKNALLPEELSVEQVVLRLGGFAASLLALLAIALLSRKYCRDNGLDPLRRHSRQARITGVFTAICRRLRRLGLAPEADSQTEAFLAFVCAHLKDARGEDAAFVRAARDALYESIYGERPITEQDIRSMRKLKKRLFRGKKQK